jgi:hypothetical protein
MLWKQWALVLCVLFPGIARADQSGADDFARGMQLYRGGDCAGAIRPLEYSSRLGNYPGGLMALGYCYRQLKQFAKATDAYQRYLQLHADDEKRVVMLLEETLQEEREWRRDHPEEPPSPPPPEPAAPAQAPAQLPPVEPPGRTVKLVLQSNNPLTRIQRMGQSIELSSGGGRVASAVGWTDVCGVPCGIAVPADAQLRVGGGDISPSDPFVLPQGREMATVSAKTGSSSYRSVGLVGMLVGGGAVLSGLLGLAIAPSSSQTGNPQFDQASADNTNRFKTFAGGVAIVGVVALVVGGTLYFQGRTTVTLN